MLQRFKIFFVSSFIILFCSFYGTNVYAIEINNYNFKGYGTQYDPYLINSYEDICTLRDIVDSGNTFTGIWFKQTQDIVFPNDEVWNPIGDLKAGITFSGYYNGNGHTISNIYCEDQYAGLFSYLDGEVRNLGIESGVFKGDTIGSITSHGTQNACIVNCYNKADIIGDARAGGIADNFAGTILFCWNMGNVNGSSENALTAGICSYGSSKIMYCYNLGTEKPVNDITFSGNMVDSVVISQTDIETAIGRMYEQMWNVYSAGGILQNNNKRVLINRGNVTFMCFINGNLIYNVNYEPDIFQVEKENNKLEFLSVYDTRFDFVGTGSEEAPFQIANYEDLVRLRDCVDIGVTYQNYYFLQTNDIDFPDGINWEPIGDLKKQMLFSGVYDGNGHTISNVYCEDQYAGLFSYLDGEVRNLGIESGVFKGDTIGSIASHGTENACIFNCYNKAKVIGKTRAGGIADNFSGKILFCWNLAEVIGPYTGGIISYDAKSVKYCHSVFGDQVVNLLAFDGEQIESSIVKSEIQNTLLNDYRGIGTYIADNMIDLDNIVFYVFDGEELIYDPTYIPNQIMIIEKIKYLLEYILFSISVIIGTITCFAIYRHRRPFSTEKLI